MLGQNLDLPQKIVMQAAFSEQVVIFDHFDEQQLAFIPQTMRQRVRRGAPLAEHAGQRGCHGLFVSAPQRLLQRGFRGGSQRRNAFPVQPAGPDRKHGSIFLIEILLPGEPRFADADVGFLQETIPAAADPGR